MGELAVICIVASVGCEVVVPFERVRFVGGTEVVRAVEDGVSERLALPRHVCRSGKRGLR